jgi:hypothetical protein
MLHAITPDGHHMAQMVSLSVASKSNARGRDGQQGTQTAKQ